MRRSVRRIGHTSGVCTVDSVSHPAKIGDAFLSLRPRASCSGNFYRGKLDAAWTKVVASRFNGVRA